MSAVERAAEVLRTVPKWNGAGFTPASPREAAKALADAGLLVTDADRAVLDTADAWVASAGTSVGVFLDRLPAARVLAAAVRARREAQT